MNTTKLDLFDGRFPLGSMFLTPGALNAIVSAAQSPLDFFLPHAQGDWGELCAEDLSRNDHALIDGSRLFSAHRTRLGVRLWVITEADRSATTILLPEEY